MMDKERAAYLLDRYHAGNCTPVERAEFVLLLHHPKFEALRHELLDDRWPERGDVDGQHAESAMYEKVLAAIKARPRTTRERSLRPWRSPLRKLWPYAAAVVLALSIGLLFWQRAPQNEAPEHVSTLDDIQPGGNRATLTLASGQIIDLSESRNGIVVGEEDVRYKDGTSLGLAPSEQLVLTTPKGGTYQVTLPDGTNVWLNAGSILRYPSRFDEEQRVVELSGEAYFDVVQLQSKHAKNGKIPFLVRTDKQMVEVLGTQFNLSAYAEDADVKTTLVEGSVRVASPTDEHGSVVLKPGQQSIYGEGNVAVKTVDIGPFIAWKDGYFNFLYTPFPEMIAQISRWYDIELVYRGEVPTETFSGKMSRNVTLRSMLKFFEGSAIKVTLENNKLIIGE